MANVTDSGDSPVAQPLLLPLRVQFGYSRILEFEGQFPTVARAFSTIDFHVVGNPAG